MNSDRLSRAHEQKYWDGAMVRDLTDFSMMLWKLVSPSLPGAGVPSPLCAVRPPTLTRCHTGLLCGAGPGALAGHPCSCPQLLDWCCEGWSPLDGVGTALAESFSDLLGPAADKPLGVNSAAWKCAKWE